MQLRVGQNARLTADGVTVTCRWRAAAGIDADLSALQLGADRRVRSDADFVFYNQPASVDGATTHAGKRVVGCLVEDRVTVDLARLDGDVHVVAVVVSGDGVTVVELPELAVEVAADDGSPIAGFTMPTLTTETAVVTVEVYRRDGGWKIRAVGQGYSDGLAGLARDFGVSVDDHPADTDPAVSSPVDPPPLPGTDWTDPPVPAGYAL